MAKKKRVGRQIVQGLHEAIAYERGELPDVRVSRVSLTARSAHVRPAPPFRGQQIARLRNRLKLSQPVFAHALNVSPETVRAWEQEKRVPDGAVLRLLQVAERHPEVILEYVASRTG